MEKPEITVEEYHDSNSPHRTIPTVSVLVESELQLYDPPPPPPPSVPPPPLVEDCVNYSKEPENPTAARPARRADRNSATERMHSSRVLELCGAHCCHADLTALCTNATGERPSAQLSQQLASARASPCPSRCSVLVFEPHAHWSRTRSLRAPSSHYQPNANAQVAIACDQRGVPLALCSPCDTLTPAFLFDNQPHVFATAAAAGGALMSGAPRSPTLVTSPHAHLIFGPTSISVPLVRTPSGATDWMGSKRTSSQTASRSNSANKTTHQPAGSVPRSTALSTAVAAAATGEAADESGTVRFCVGGGTAAAGGQDGDGVEEAQSSAEAVRLCGALAAADSDEGDKAELTKGQKRVSRAVVIVTCVLLLLSVALIAFTLAISEHIDQMVLEKMERALSERGALAGASHDAAFSRSPFSSATPAPEAYADVSAFAADGTGDGGGGVGVSAISGQHASVSPPVAANSVQMLTPSSH